MMGFSTACRVAAFAFVAVLVLQAGVARAEIKKQYIDYKQGNAQLSGLLVYDDAQSGKRPGVLLAHDRTGIAPNAFRDAELIARMGYVVFVADMFGKGVVPKDIPEMDAQIGIYNNDRALMRARVQPGFDLLKSNPMIDAAKIAVVGYCFGGTVGIELAETGAPIAGLVLIHGSYRGFSPEATKNIKAPVLILHGAEDPVAPIADITAFIDQLRAAKISWQLELYSGTTHAFTNPKGPSEERADREHKVALTRFLKETLGG